MAAVRREIKQRQRRESRERADMLRWGLTAHMVRMTLAVYCLSNYSQDCAIEFAENARKRRALQVPSLDDAPCPIRDLFLRADLADLIAIFVPETKQHWCVRATACKYWQKGTLPNGWQSKIFPLAGPQLGACWWTNLLRNFRALAFKPALVWTRREPEGAQDWDAWPGSGASRCGENGACGGDIYRKESC